MIVTNGMINTIPIFGGNELKSLRIPDNERIDVTIAQPERLIKVPLNIVFFLRSVKLVAARLFRSRLNKSPKKIRVVAINPA